MKDTFLKVMPWVFEEEGADKQMIAILFGAVQAHIDVTAQQRQYDSGYTCASYFNSTNPLWAAEAQAFIAWRDAVWAYSFAELAKVEDGEREQPTVEQFVAELAAAVPMEWPS